MNSRRLGFRLPCRRAPSAGALAVIAASALCLLPLAARAESVSQSVTGIPVEYLFLSIGALLAVIYADIKHQIKSLQRDGHLRSAHIKHVENVVRKMCSHLDIDYKDRQEDL